MQNWFGRSWAFLGPLGAVLRCLLGALGLVLGVSWSLLGLSWGVLGRLGASWAGLGVLLGPLWGSWARLGRVLERLGAILGPPGALLGRSWDLLGRSKIDQKIDLKSDPKSARIATAKNGPNLTPTDVSEPDQPQRKEDPATQKNYQKGYPSD